MYSYEDRLHAVRLYLKLGKRIGATIRQLGYSTKNALKSWYREYEQCHDLRAGYVRLRPRYSAEHKQAAVDHYLSHGRCAAATLKALGYPCRATLAACRAIISMAHALRIRVIAEGIETESQRDILLAAGCDYGEGYFFCPPVDPSAFEAFVSTVT